MASSSSSRTEELVLLESPGSPFAMRVRVALASKGLHYRTVLEDLTQPKSDLLLQVNPVHKKIPVLIHKGKPICESLLIVEYIDEVWKDGCRPLLPVDPYQRANAKFWADFIDKKVSPASDKLWEINGEIEGGKKEFIEAIKVLEGEITSKPYFGGECMGFLDIAFIPFFYWFHAFEKFAKFSIEAECPKLVAWGKRCMEEEYVHNSLPHPHDIYDLAIEFKQKMGI